MHTVRNIKINLWKVTTGSKGRIQKMEMCYDGALVMPSSYVTMNEEEMTYTEGGSKSTRYTDLSGLFWRIVGCANGARKVYSAIKKLATVTNMAVRSALATFCSGLFGYIKLLYSVAEIVIACIGLKRTGSYVVTKYLIGYSVSY